MAVGEAGGGAAILNLFTEDNPILQLEDVERVLEASAATAYRYLAELSESGILSRISGGYSLGPKILELEYLISKFDPLLVAARDVMARPCVVSGADARRAAPLDGLRPSTPDTLPVLGPVRSQRELHLAFVHGHYGITAGPPSGRLVASLVVGAASPIPESPYRIERFAG